jgi:hypothetical protein
MILISYREVVWGFFFVMMEERSDPTEFSKVAIPQEQWNKFSFFLVKAWKLDWHPTHSQTNSIDFPFHDKKTRDFVGKDTKDPSKDTKRDTT